MFKFFKKKSSHTLGNIINKDVHSHLLAGIDDGVKTLEEAKKIIIQFIALGYKKLITTPHIMHDYYKNTPEIITSKLNDLKNFLTKENIEIEIEAAAEYYLDDWFINHLENKNPLLTFGDNYLLFETSFMSRPRQIFEVVFELQAQGYKPVFAHPERYQYVYDDFGFLEKMVERNVILQVNLNSILGYYGKNAKKTAELLIDQNMIKLVGSDCHNERHILALKDTQKKKYYHKLQELELLNDSL